MDKVKSISKTLNTSAFFCFLFALFLAFLLRLFKFEGFLEWYSKYTDSLLYFELWMQTYGASVVSVIFILLNYTVKAVIPWFPISCICVVAGVLFEWYYAFIINIVGLAILFTIKFAWGKKFGGGNAEKILSHYEGVYRFINKNQVGSPIVLFVLRLVPCVPVNSVSALFGSTDITYSRFMLVSFLGFSHKLFSYTLIGRNVFDPASASFVFPFILLSVVSGLALLLLNPMIKIPAVSNKINQNKREVD